MEKSEKAVITVIGKDMVGILAKVTALCAEKDVKVDITKATASVAELADIFDELGEKMDLKIHIMHEDIFNSMHKI